MDKKELEMHKGGKAKPSNGDYKPTSNERIALRKIAEKLDNIERYWGSK